MTDATENLKKQQLEKEWSNLEKSAKPYLDEDIFRTYNAQHQLSLE